MKRRIGFIAMALILFMAFGTITAFAGGSSERNIVCNTSQSNITVYGQSVTASNISSPGPTGQARAISNTGSAMPVDASVCPGSSSTSLVSVKAYPGTGYKLSSVIYLTAGNTYRVKVHTVSGYTSGNGLASIQ